MQNSFEKYGKTFLAGLYFCGIASFQGQVVASNYAVFESSHTPKFIYTNSPVNSYIYVINQASSISISSILMDLQIEHDFIGELIVQLVSPQRHKITISYFNGFLSVLSIDGQPLSSFSSNLPAYINPNGLWSLSVLDLGYNGYGWLNSWGLAFPDPLTIQYSFGGVVFVTVDGGIHYSTSGEQVGQKINLGAIRLRDSRGNLLSASNFAAAFNNVQQLGAEIGIQNNGNFLKVALPNFTAPRRGGNLTYSSSSVMDFNLANGRNEATRTIAGVAETVALEMLYNADLNADGIRGDVVALSLGGGVFVGSSGALFWSNQQLSIGQSIASDSILLRDSQGAPFAASTFESAYNAALARGAQVAVISEGQRLNVIIPQFASPKRGGQLVFSGVQSYLLNLSTGRMEGTQVFSQLAGILALESQYAKDFNGDGMLGDAVVMDLGEGLYATSSGAVYYSQGVETVGNVVSGASSVMIRDAKGVALPANVFRTAYTDSGGRIGVVEEIDSQSGQTVLNIGLPQYIVPKRSNLKVFSSVAVYSVNPVTGQAAAPAIVGNLTLLLAEESRFQQDFNRDGVVGDAVVMDFGGNLYVTSSGGVYYSHGGETVGNVVSGASSVMLRDAKGVALPANVFRTAHTDSGGRIGVVEEIDSQSGQTVLKIGLPLYTVPKRSSVKVFSSVTIYTVNPVTGVSGAPSAVKNFALSLVEESRFQKDFNQNGAIGI